MLTDRERLIRRKSRPALVALHNALTRLTSTLTVMNTGAHPDDEQSGMLAVLRHAYGMRVVVACSTRGEGGQNGLGPERGGALGVLRTRELEEAMRTLDADIAWLGFGPDDPVHDFGFSKNGADTLARWGRERIVERLVRAYRAERPDIVIPTFLDVPGQHGHHRAMTEAAEAAVALAADPAAFPEHFAEGLSPWRVAKFYLPGWSGGGGTYDDETPPPNATVAVVAPGRDAATGAAFAEIGQWSRLSHASQGMGRWSAVPQTRWPLHLASGGGDEGDIRDGLPADLGALADAASEGAAEALRAAEARIEAARAAFPDARAILAALGEAADALAAADGKLTPAERAEHGHRVARKQRELSDAAILAAGIEAAGWLDRPALAPGETTTLNVQVTENAHSVAIEPVAPAGVRVEPIEGAPGLTRFAVSIAPGAALTSPWAPGFTSLGGNGGLYLRLTAEIDGRKLSVPVDLEEPLAIVPAHNAELDPPAVILPLPPAPTPIAVALRLEGPPATPELASVPGIAIERAGAGFVVTPQPTLAPGRHHLPLTIAGRPAYRRAEIAYPHIGRTRYHSPAALEVLALDLALPEGARVGYVGGGADHVGEWLERMGADVADLGPAELAGRLDRFTTIVVGIFAFGLRPDLAAAAPRLHAWVRDGGHLVTLYHRPSDGWNPDATPPARLVIGSPSLRWRVTDPAAPVTMLAPGHRLLAAPNRIGPRDWAGWDKERGLYFAAEWDAAYQPLLAMSDAGEAPLEGALVSARIGAGRHTHVALVLHHQMNRLVPGAFRLMANLLQPA